VALRYFDALAAHDLDAATACWPPGANERLVGQQEPVAPDGAPQEGDEVAGFRVIDLPGHAPALIGLFRDSDRLALVSDCFYTLDIQTGVKGAARVPHPAFNIDTEQARSSIRKLAAMSPSVAWPGHAGPVRGDTVGQLERAASAPA
jgi:hydroxyacylglutathione hydrolase